MNEVIHREHATMPGAESTLRLVQKLGIKSGIISQSSLSYMNRAIKELDFDTTHMLIKSAENEEFGKPHPSVYLRAAVELQVDTTHCLVIEDSLNGVIAAKAARMNCIAMPNHDMADNPAFQIADKIIASLQDIDETLITQFGGR